MLRKKKSIKTVGKKTDFQLWIVWGGGEDAKETIDLIINEEVFCYDKRAEEVKKRGRMLKESRQKVTQKSGARIKHNLEREGSMVSGVVRFNWASGSRTCCDNIKGQIYIKHCWEMSTSITGGCKANRQRWKKTLGTYTLKRKSPTCPALLLHYYQVTWQN